MRYNIHNLTKRYDDLLVFQDFQFGFSENQITCILGPSGCGKTTLLNLFAGTESFEQGKLSVPEDISLSYIFQEPRLLPWKTVRENMLFVLHSKYSRHEALEMAERFLELVNLSAFADFYPRQLSGGMKQRVSIARAFAFPSQLILMDEPFKGLDFKLKEALIEAFRALWQRYRRTVLFVTHDIDEALKMADELVIFSQPPIKEYKRMNLQRCLQGRSIEDESYIDVKKNVIAALH